MQAGKALGTIKAVSQWADRHPGLFKIISLCAPHT